MKYRYLVLLMLFLAVVSVAAEEVAVTNFVNDYAGIISQEYNAKLTVILKQMKESGIAEFSVVTVKSLQGRDIESYSLELAQGRLGDKEKNNGLLLLIAVDDRKYRFEVGRGLEAVLNDAKIGRIGRTYLQPNFRPGNYDGGVYSAVLAVNSILRGEPTPLMINAPADEIRVDTFLFLAFMALIGVFLFKTALLKRLRKHTQDESNKYYRTALLATWLLQNSGHGGHGGSGGFGGGFGGFGGGGFSGGGASGGW